MDNAIAIFAVMLAAFGIIGFCMSLAYHRREQDLVSHDQRRRREYEARREVFYKFPFNDQK